MMITLPSQQYGTAETEIMMDGRDTERERKRERGVQNVNATHFEETQQ